MCVCVCVHVRACVFSTMCSNLIQLVRVGAKDVTVGLLHQLNQSDQLIDVVYLYSLQV